MMRTYYFLNFWLWLFTGSIQAQEIACNSIFDANADNKCYAIKFKVLPWISVPSGSGINPSIGFEYGITKKQSLGIDLFYNQYSFSSGDSYDSIQNMYVGNPRVSNRDKAIFINYRYYLSANKLRKANEVCYYIGSFLRFGQLTFKYDKGYVSRSNIVREEHFSLGGMFGLVSQTACFKNGKSFCIDGYAGLYIKQKVQSIEYYTASNSLHKEKDYPVNLGFRIGLTFSVVGKRK